MENNFIKLPLMILGSEKLTLTEKVLISMILSFQSNNLTCTKSNKTLAQELSMSEISLKRLIAKLNKTNWFTSESTSKHNEFGKWINSKEMRINLEELKNYLDTDDMKKTHLQAENKVEQEEINNSSIISTPIEEKVTEIKDNEVKIDIRTEEQKMEEDLFKSLVIDSDKDDSDSSETFTYTNIHDTFDIPIKFKKTLEWGLSKTIWEKKIKTSQKIFGLIAVLENIDDLLNTLNEYENKINIINNETK